MTEQMLLQRVVVVGGFSHKEVEVNSSLDRLKLQVNREYGSEPITGLLLIYPTCLLTVVECSGDVLVSILQHMQTQSFLLQVKVLFLEHQPPGRRFQQWYSKVLDADGVLVEAGVRGQEGVKEEEEAVQLLVLSVLSALQRFSTQMEMCERALPDLLSDGPLVSLVVPQKTLEKLLEVEDLLSVQQHLQLYHSPLDVQVDCGNTDLLCISMVMASPHMTHSAIPET